MALLLPWRCGSTLSSHCAFLGWQVLQTKPSLPDGKLELPPVSAADSAAYAAGQRKPVHTAGRSNGASNGASASASSNNGAGNGAGPNGAVSSSRQQPGASTSGRAVKLELRVRHSRTLKPLSWVSPGQRVSAPGEDISVGDEAEHEPRAASQPVLTVIDTDQAPRVRGAQTDGKPLLHSHPRA